MLKIKSPAFEQAKTVEHQPLWRQLEQRCHLRAVRSQREQRCLERELEQAGSLSYSGKIQHFFPFRLSKVNKGVLSSARGCAMI